MTLSNSMIEFGDDNSLSVSVSLCSPSCMLCSTASTSGLSMGVMFLLSAIVLSVCSAGGVIRLVGGPGVTDVSSSTPNRSTGEGSVSVAVGGMRPMLLSLSNLVSRSPCSSCSLSWSAPLTAVAGAEDRWLGSTAEYGGGLELCPARE